jgi:hypothetical protein
MAEQVAAGIRKISPEACDFQNLFVLQPRGQNYNRSKLWLPEKTVNDSRFLSHALSRKCKFGDDDDSVVISATFDETRIHSRQRVIKQYQNLALQLVHLNMISC